MPKKVTPPVVGRVPEADKLRLARKDIDDAAHELERAQVVVRVAGEKLADAQSRLMRLLTPK